MYLPCKGLKMEIARRISDGSHFFLDFHGWLADIASALPFYKKI
jgi:hypothetical protein